MNIATIANTEVLPAHPVIAAALWNPPERAQYLQAEVTAFCELSKILADDPRVALRRFLEIALRLCKAGSAGVSLLRSSAAGEATVHWEAISGALAVHEGSDATRDSSPCGLCLDAGTTILLSRPERVFTYLTGTRPSIVQIVPLYDSASQPLGTLWVAHHDSASRFSSDDARMMEQLAVQLILALKLLEQAREHRHALALLESHEMARRALTDALAEERRHRERSEAAESGARQALEFKDVVIREVHHRVKAIPLALLANELITNAYKHAFPQGSVGEIVLSLSPAAEPGLVLHVSDNGVGMRPNGVETGLGLQLIRAFAAQLHGTLAFAESIDGTGTAVTLTLPRGAKPRSELELQS